MFYIRQRLSLCQTQIFTEQPPKIKLKNFSCVNSFEKLFSLLSLYEIEKFPQDDGEKIKYAQN